MFLTLFDDFWRFLPCAKIVEKCRKTFWHFLTIFDVFWRGPFPPAPFAIRRPVSPKAASDFSRDSGPDPVAGGGLRSSQACGTPPKILLLLQAVLLATQLLKPISVLASVLHEPGRRLFSPTEPETGGMLFREYCFGEENSLSLTEFWGKLGEFCENLGEFALAHK